MSDPKVLNEAWNLAKTARQNAYAPYSQFTVGAVVKLRDHDELFPGCNIENASNGATRCAEQIAIGNSFANNGKAAIGFVMVIGKSDDPLLPPCGICLQVMSEFFDKDSRVILTSENIGPDHKDCKILSLDELMPYRFTSEDL